MPGRFFPERRNIPNWNNDLAPRLSGAYDLFGNGRTALKASWSSTTNGSRAGSPTHAPGVQTETRNWFDCDLNAARTACSGVVLPTNADDIAQDNEIGLSGTSNFGTTVSDRDMDPDIRRQGDTEFTATISHQLLPRLSVTAGWYHRTYQDLRQMDRTLITTSDYTSFPTPMPDISRDATLVGVIDPSEVLTVYNLNAAKRSVFNAAGVDKNVDDRSIYDGVDVTFNARLAGGTTCSEAGTERNLSAFCSSDDNPNGPPVADLYTGASVSNGGGSANRARSMFRSRISSSSRRVHDSVDRRRCRRDGTELCGAGADHHVSAAGQPLPRRTDEH